MGPHKGYQPNFMERIWDFAVAPDKGSSTTESRSKWKLEVLEILN